MTPINLRSRSSLLVMTLTVSGAWLLTPTVQADEGLDYLPPDAAHGDWGEHLYAGPSTVADYLVRVGDIDNLGTGWDLAYRPFNGTKPRAFKRVKHRPDDTAGTDLDKWPLADADDPAAGRAIVLSADFFSRVDVTAARIAVFVGRTAKGRSALNATLNGKPAPFVADALNAADIPLGQGRLINMRVPEAYIDDLDLGSFSLVLSHRADDTPHLAIDFVACYLNPKPLDKRSSTRLTGQVVDRRDGVALRGVTVNAAGHTTTTDERGRFRFASLPAGHTIVHLGPDSRRVSHAIDLRGDRPAQRTLAY